MKIFSTGWSEGYDGPGRRWVVYLKGCNLRCQWCANPESLEAGPQMLFYAARGEDFHEACPKSAVKKDQSGRWHLDRAVCAACGLKDCVNLWRHPAMELSGFEMSPAEILERVERSRDLFGRGGGVTFGGGEPTLQMDELIEAVELVRGIGVHVAAETNATAHDFGRIICRVDLLICDLKCVDPARHLKWTGMENSRILANLRAAAAGQKDLWIRIPAVAGLNSDDAEIARLADVIAELVGLRAGRGLFVEILPMHHLGQPKYHALDMDYPMDGVGPPDSRRLERMRQVIAKTGADVHLAGSQAGKIMDSQKEKIGEPK
ncbi:MAG: glycyl-radical enzyme activating protein [Planctomycetes bacterium]|nr:glycyl-radical enzyme activating protein [Planctomycetota bacterium]